MTVMLAPYIVVCNSKILFSNSDLPSCNSFAHNSSVANPGSKYIVYGSVHVESNLPTTTYVQTSVDQT